MFVRLAWFVGLALVLVLNGAQSPWASSEGMERVKGIEPS
jgi:hypothetical protein